MNLNELSNEEFFEQIDSLKPDRKDELYRYLWTDYVREDMRAIFEGRDVPYLSDNDFEALIDDCANQFVHNGWYDCNTDYWTNLENLIGNRLRLFEQKHK